MTQSVRSSLASRLLFPAALAGTVFGFGVYFDHASTSASPPQERIAAIDGELEREAASAEVRRIAQWAIATQDPAGLPFVVVDPGRARIYAFDPQGRLTGNAPVRIRADTMPAGRLVADPIGSARSGAIVWTQAETQLAIGASEDDADKPAEAALSVDPAFWRACLATLRMQPSIAYVLPPLAAVIKADAHRRPS
jgi:hypothetical protein